MNNHNSNDCMAQAMQTVRALVQDKGRRFYVSTFGCQQNEADSEKLRGLCAAMGYLPAAVPEEASLILVNTCAIRRLAELKALSMIGRFKHIKTADPEVLIGVCGCMAAEPGMVAKLKTDFPYVSFTLEPNRMLRLPELVAAALLGGRRSFVLGEDDGSVTEGLPTLRTEGHRAYVSIMYGCNNFCSYCIVPYVRGRERSRDAALVLEECRGLIASGVKEITLLGQNVNSYRSTVDFAGLLEQICRLEGDFLVRFMTSHPKDVSDRLIEVMRTHTDRIAPAFHLPLQSGSNRILARMNRSYTREKYLATVEKLRAAVPEIVLTTDVIVAFPGETEEDFLDTMQMLRQVRYDMIFSFIYSPREGTKAAGFDNPLTEEDKERRMAMLLAEQKQIAWEKNQPYLGTRQRVLCDGPAREGEGHYIGRTPGGKLVRFTAAEDPGREFVYVTIDKATPFDLFGTLQVGK